MAVYTEVAFEDAATLAKRLGLDQLQRLTGITSGIENTNYFLTTGRGEFVLTLFERLNAEQLPFYLRLMEHLAEKGVPVPQPREDAEGEILHTLAGKPAAIVDKLAGQPLTHPRPEHCSQVGRTLAAMHLAGRDFTLAQPNLRGLAWWIETVPVVAPYLTPARRTLLEDELRYQQTLAERDDHRRLPRGPVHADLFRDNVMFDGDRLTGFFDFYFAGVDTFLFDVAVCVNDWCVDLDTGRFDGDRLDAFRNAYASVRPFSSDEDELFADLLRAAALRFWLSRLWDWHLPRKATQLKPHDPEHFERILKERRRQSHLIS